MKKQITTTAVALTLALIPLTAFAAYMAQQLEGQPIVSELVGEDTITNEWKVVGTKTIPQTKLDNMLTDVKNSLRRSEPKLTQEEINRRELLGQKRMIEERLAGL